MRMLLSCLCGGPQEKVPSWGLASTKQADDLEAPPDGRHALHKDTAKAHHTSPVPLLVSTPPCSLPNWEPLSWEATFFSVAIVASDTQEVLFKKRGLEPAAAQLLDQALLLGSRSCHPSNAPDLEKGDDVPDQHVTNTAYSSFLTALLGPELEAVAVSKARQSRWWKGSISAKLPVQHTALGLDGAPVNSGGGPSPNPSMTQLCLEGPSTDNSAGRQEHAPLKRKTLEECESRESVRSEVAPATTTAAAAAAAAASAAQNRRGSAPDELCLDDFSSSKDSSVRGGGRRAPKWSASSPSLRQDDSSKRVQWSCPEVDLPGTSSKSGPLDQIDEDVAAMRQQTQSSPQAPLLSAPLQRTVRANHPAVRKSKSCLSSHNQSLAEEQEEGEVEGKEGTQSPGSLPRAPCSFRSKRGPKESRKAPSRGPSFSRRSSLLLTPEAAIEQLEHGNEDGATRTVALLKSLSQGVRHEARGVSSKEMPVQDFGSQCTSAPSTRQQQLFDAGVHGSFSYSSVPSHTSQNSSVLSPRASEPPSMLSEASPMVHKTAAPHSAVLPPSIHAHENTRAARPPIVSVSLNPTSNLPGPSTSSNFPSSGAMGYSSRSAEGSYPVCQSMAANSVGKHPHEGSSQRDSTNPLYQGLTLQDGSSSHLGVYQSGLSESPMPSKDQHWQRSEAKNSLASPLEPAERTSQSASEDEDEIPTQSFDVMVTTLSEDAKSPLLVSIFNCTEHWQVRATLTTLAEQQLELLSSIMPQHAIQFLAMESTDAVPECVGQLARAHSDVTLLFMDIVGFTSMSKSVKPVEVMIFLNKLFSLFDRLTDVHKVHKVETAGDCYIVGGGIMSPDQSANGFQCVTDDQDPAESAKQVMEFAKALLEAAKQVRMPDTNEPVRVRVGLHTGDVVSGLIGSKMPKFSIFGDTMNTASRMESTGVPGRIHVSETTQRLLPQESWESTGGVEVKGKGRMQTYLWVPPASSKPASQQQVQQPLVHSGSGVQPLPCSFIRQAQQAHTLLKHLGPAPTLKHLGRFNNEVFVAEPINPQPLCT